MPNRSSRRGPGGGVDRQRTVLADESVHRQHRLGQLGRVDPGQLLQRDELALPQRACGEREQPRYRHHRLADTRLVHLAGEPGGHVLGRQHRVDPARTDLVGARRDADHPERPGGPPDQLTDLHEQRDVGGVEGAQQEHHGVDARNTVVGHQQPQCALGDVPGQRRRPRGVDDRGVDQFRGGPLHVQVDDVLWIQGGEVESETTLDGVTADRHIGPPTAPMIGGHLRRGTVPEPGDDAGGLGGVGGRNVLAHKGIHQSRLTRLEGARQRDADRLIESAADPVQLVVHIGTFGVGGIGAVGLDGSAQDRAHLITRAHRQTSLERVR